MNTFGPRNSASAQQRQPDVAGPVDVEQIELLLAQGAVEVVGRAETDRRLEEGPAAAERAGAPDANHAVAPRRRGPARRSAALAPGQDRDLHALDGTRRLRRWQDVLLNASQGGEIALGDDTDAERTHGAVAVLPY